MATTTRIDETVHREILFGAITGHPIIKEDISRVITEEDSVNHPPTQPQQQQTSTSSHMDPAPSSNSNAQVDTTKSWRWGRIILVSSIVLFIAIYLIVRNYRRDPLPKQPKTAATAKAPAEDPNKTILDRIDSVAKESKTNTEESIKNAFKDTKSEIEAAKKEITKSIPTSEEIKKVVSTEIENRTKPVYDRMATLEKKYESLEKKLSETQAPTTTVVTPAIASPQQHTVTIRVETPQQTVAQVSQPAPVVAIQTQPAPATPKPIVVIPNAPPPPPAFATYPVSKTSIIKPDTSHWKRTITLDVHKPSKKYSAADIRNCRVGWQNDAAAQAGVTVRLYLNKRHMFAGREFIDVDFPITKEKLQNVDHVVFIPREKPFEISEK